MRRELPSVLLRIGTAEAEQALVASLLESDGTIRHRIIASLNKLRAVRPDIHIDPTVVELLLAAEIAGHYRSYQVLGPLRAQLKEGDAVIQALRHSMEQELERIFRLMALLLPQAGLHDAYVGVRSSNPTVRANALEFLDNVLKPELRHVLVPVLDAQVTVEERIEIANRLVGAPLETPDQAVATLLDSEDPWLRSCAIQAVGTLRLGGLVPQLKKYEASGGSAGPRRRRRRARPPGRRFAPAARAAASARPRISISASARGSGWGSDHGSDPCLTLADPCTSWQLGGRLVCARFPASAARSSAPPPAPRHRGRRPDSARDLGG